MARSGCTLRPAAKPSGGGSFLALAGAGVVVTTVTMVLPTANLAAAIHHIGTAMFTALRAVLVRCAPPLAVVGAAKFPPIEVESTGSDFVALTLAAAFPTAA